MKYIKTFNESINIQDKIYYLDNPKSNYEYIIVLDQNNNLKGIVNAGFNDDNMTKNNIFTIGTIWGPGCGDLLYAGLIKYYGKIIPSRNISNQAKINWVRKMKDPDYIISTKEGIGFYSVYVEEDILNNIVDLKPEIKNKIVINTNIKELPEYDKICEDVKAKHNFMGNNFMEDKMENYTFGESRDRFEWISKNYKLENRAIEIYLLNKPKEFFKHYNIPFAEENDQMSKKYLALL